MIKEYKFYKNNQIYIKSAVVLLSDNVIKLVIGFVLSVLVARYFGPEKFGQINYVTAFIGILQVFILFGFEDIVLKDIGLGLFPEVVIIGTVIKLRLALAVFVFSIGVGIFYFFLDKSLVFIYLILGMQLFIYSFHIFRQWYQIKSLNKYTVIASQAGFLCISIAKIVLILFVKDIIWYAFILTGGSFIEMFFLFYFFKKKSGNKSIEKFDIKYARHLLHSSLPLLFQNFAVFIYMRIDQLMIGKMLSVDRLGIYSVAVSIAEIVNIVPMAIINAAYPKIVLAKKEGRDYETLLVKIGSLNISLCLLFAAGCTIFAPYFITKLYGAAYADAGRVIQIYSWASVFTAVGVSHSCFITFNNMQKYSLIAISIAATMNVIGNFIFIPLLGINGAAITTVLSYSVAAYFFYAFIKDKQTFYLRTKSLFFRWG